MKREDFICRSKLLYGSKFNYDLLPCKINTNHKVTVTCKHHGEITPFAHNHLRGIDCKFCARERTSEQHKLTLEEFITRSIAVHGDRYDYTETVYAVSKQKVEIYCPEHGYFS